jgi:ATP-dependent protease ClpP protease subunit
MRSWYEFTAKAETKETEIFIYDVIGSYSVSAARFIAELQSVPKDHRLILRLHSPGGSVFEGNAIFNAIKAHPGGCTTQVDGLAASMASVLAIAGSPARMARTR